VGLELLSGNLPAVTLAEMVDQLRLDGLDVQSDLLGSLIAAACGYVQTETRQQLTTSTWRLNLDGFPCGDTITIPRPPLASVASVKYLDLSGVEQTLSTSAYTVDAASRPGRVALNFGHIWPLTLPNANAVRIEFAAGYGTSAAVPEILKTAVKMLAAHWYENREAAGDRTVTEVPFAVRSILDQNMYPEA
jgi:uncharacterized phiE125 gp8 family phage protein